MDRQADSNNKRIVKNTLLLYFRTLFILFIKLYSSRLILEYLGVTDYGIYSLVASFIAMFSIFNSSLTSTIQRFLTFSLGLNDMQKVRNIFSASINILATICLIVIVFGETIGLFYLNTKLQIPLERLVAANWVYQFSLFTFVLGVITVPYNAILTAYENFKIFAYFDILNTVLGLAVIFLIPIIPMDRLVFYGLGLALVAVIIRFIYSCYCVKHYPTAHYYLVKDKYIYKELFSFSAWSFLGNTGTIISEGGLNVVMNIFFGVTINSAKGIGTQVSNAVGGFIRSFITAMNPQITKNYAEKNMERMQMLVFNSAKFSFLLLGVLVIPVIIDTPFLLNLWLVKTPDYTILFTRLILIQATIHVLFNSTNISVNASGKIKEYQIGNMAIQFASIIFVYIAFKLGLNAYSGLVIQCVFTTFLLFFDLYIQEKVVGFSINAFIKKVILPCALVFSLSIGLSYFAKFLIMSSLNILWLSLITSLMICFIVTYFIGLTRNQKKIIISTILKKINKTL